MAQDFVYSLQGARRHQASVLRANFADIIQIDTTSELGIKITTTVGNIS